MKNPLPYIIVIILFFFVPITYLKVSAQGNLLITPKRVVFDGTKKSYALNLANTGDDTTRYDISLAHFKMKEDGSLEKVSQNDTSDRYADKYLRFYPHSVVLPPHSSQSVRIQVTNWNALDTGEYRSNLHFRAMPNTRSQQPGEMNKDSGITIKIIPLIGISIPVIIQVGKSTAEVNLSNISIQKVSDSLSVLMGTFNRRGNMSVYGDISVDYISPQGKVIQTGILKGIAVYTPNAIRHFKLRLNNFRGINYQTGKLYIKYHHHLMPGKVIAETQVDLK